MWNRPGQAWAAPTAVRTDVTQIERVQAVRDPRVGLQLARDRNEIGADRGKAVHAVPWRDVQRCALAATCSGFSWISCAALRTTGAVSAGIP